MPLTPSPVCEGWPAETGVRELTPLGLCQLLYAAVTEQNIVMDRADGQD